MKKTLRVDMVTRCSVYVSVDAEKFDIGDIDLEDALDLTCLTDKEFEIE